MVELQMLKSIEALSLEWIEERETRIPASLVRRAVTMTEAFITHYGGCPMEEGPGHKVEALLLRYIPVFLKKTGMWVHPEYQWLSCSPDGIYLQKGIPIEVKCKMNVNVDYLEVVRDNYHQMQFTMFCTRTHEELVIIVSDRIHCYLLQRDDKFINACLPRLAYSFTRHLLSGKLMSNYSEELINSIPDVSALATEGEEVLNRGVGQIRKNIKMKEHDPLELFPGMEKKTWEFVEKQAEQLLAFQREQYNRNFLHS